MSEFRILVATKDGTKEPKWVELDSKSEEDISREIQEFLGTPPGAPAQEWVVIDCYGIASGFSRYPEIAKMVEFCEAVQEYGESYRAYVQLEGVNWATPEGFEDAYVGEFETMIDWAIQDVENRGLLDKCSDEVRQYFDYEAYANDAETSGGVNFVRHEGTLYVFRG